MLACTLYIIHQIENRILVPFRNHFIYFRIYCIIHSLQFPRYILIISIIFPSDIPRYTSKSIMEVSRFRTKVSSFGHLDEINTQLVDANSLSDDSHFKQGILNS